MFLDGFIIFIGMWTSASYRINKWISRWVHPIEPCPKIRWPHVVRIDAMGTDAIGPFEVYVTFTHSDGSEATIFPHTKDYAEIIETLDWWYPSISPAWYLEMSKQPWHVEKLLWARD